MRLGIIKSADAVRAEQAGGVLVIINSLYMSYLIDLDNAYEPNEQTIAIHELVRPELSPLRAPAPLLTR